MSRITVNQTINVYEVDGKECALGANDKMGIHSHWNVRSFVILEFSGKTITVCADDLLQAITNAQNTGRS